MSANPFALLGAQGEEKRALISQQRSSGGAASPPLSPVREPKFVSHASASKLLVGRAIELARDPVDIHIVICIDNSKSMREKDATLKSSDGKALRRCDAVFAAVRKMADDHIQMSQNYALRYSVIMFDETIHDIVIGLQLHELAPTVATFRKQLKPTGGETSVCCLLCPRPSACVQVC